MDSENAKSATLYDLVGWLDKNKKQAAWGVGVVVAAGVIAVYVNWRSGARAVEAGEALSKLRPAQTAAGVVIPVPAADYARIAERYAKTEGGERALLLAGGAYFSEGKFDQALPAFEKFVHESPRSPLAPQASLGIAASLEAQGKLAEAATRYKEVSERYSRAPTAVPAKAALARLYEAQNKPQDALRLYQELAREEVFGSIGLEAGVRMEALLLNNPGLLGTNAAPMLKIN